METVRW